ncbi:HAD-IB family hydrolase [Acetobacteraceae bacterium]|nr:HAD-IB family hydrolase [Acetobacteraceae bacterium]
MATLCFYKEINITPFILLSLGFMTSLHSSPLHKTIFFDFDGTLSRGDSGWRFLLFCLRLRNIPRILLCLLWVLKEFFLGKMDKNKFKECCFGSVFKGRSLKEIFYLGERFVENRLQGNVLLVETMQRLEKHKAQGDRCILVSASLGEYLQFWAAKNGFETVIATRLEVGLDGRATGRFKGKNCYGSQKVVRILNYLKEEKFPKNSVAYGNSKGDFEMLQATLEQDGKSWFVLPNGKVQSWKELSRKNLKG